MPPSSRQPDPSQALALLLAQARRRFPFSVPTSRLCAGPCTGCPKKLLELADMLLEEWEEKLQQNQQPTLGDVQKVARQLSKLARAFERNQLLAE